MTRASCSVNDVDIGHLASSYACAGPSTPTLQMGKPRARCSPTVINIEVSYQNRKTLVPKVASVTEVQLVCVPIGQSDDLEVAADTVGHDLVMPGAEGAGATANIRTV